MFIGHYAVALGAKRFAPTVSLGALFLACQLADLIWPNLVLLGVEIVEIDPGNTAITPLNFVKYPWSHSLVALTLWGLVFASVYMAITRANRHVLFVIFAVVLSHWALDVISHRPDMPITFRDSFHIGLGLWNHPVPAMIVEVLLFATGTFMYANATEAQDRKGSIGFWSLIGFLLAVYVANVLGPPPPSVAAVAWSAQAMWLLVAWGYWVDRHRIARQHSER